MNRSDGLAQAEFRCRGEPANHPIAPQKCAADTLQKGVVDVFRLFGLMNANRRRLQPTFWSVNICVYNDGACLPKLLHLLGRNILEHNSLVVPSRTASFTSAVRFSDSGTEDDVARDRSGIVPNAGLSGTDSVQSVSDSILEQQVVPTPSLVGGTPSSWERYEESKEGNDPNQSGYTRVGSVHGHERPELFQSDDEAMDSDDVTVLPGVQIKSIGSDFVDVLSGADSGLRHDSTLEELHRNAVTHQSLIRFSPELLHCG